MISGHNTAANFQTNKPGNRKNSLPLTLFQNIPHRISKLPFQISFACGWHAGSTFGGKLNSLHVAFSRRLQAVTWCRHGFCLVAFEFWGVFHITVSKWKHTIVKANISSQKDKEEQIYSALLPCCYASSAEVPSYSSPTEKRNMDDLPNTQRVTSGYPFGAC